MRTQLSNRFSFWQSSSAMGKVVGCCLLTGMVSIALSQSHEDNRLRSLADFALSKVQEFIPEMDRLAPMHVEAPAVSVRADSPVVPGPPLRAPDAAWIETTLAAMTLDEKIGQMIMPGYSSGTAANLVNNYRVGGFIFQGNANTAPAVLAATNSLQGITSVPLIFSTDCEAGLGARFTDATRFPLNMGSASAYDLDLVRQQGRITARECRAIGIQIGFGPVLDVNTEPINPIIGIRSYSDNPSSVTALARAYVEGANAEGLLCTYKHFPGHGAADGDSHDELPTINIGLSDLQSQHVQPYTDLLAEGTGDLVMSAHVWYPALDPGSTPWPATLSYSAMTGILRNELGYTGCVISDSFGMAGLLNAANTYDGVKISVLAGMDIILTPASVSQAFNGLKDRVLTNEIPVSRINDSVRRILALKSRAGMPETTTMPSSGLNTVAHPDNTAIAEQIGKKAISAKLNGSVLPVLPGESLGIFVLSGNATIFYSYGSSNFTNAMTSAHANSTVISVLPSLDSSQQAALLNQARSFDKVIVASLEWKSFNHLTQRTLINSMIADGRPLAFVSFGSPYQWNQFPNLENFLCGFSSHYSTQREMARVITGQATPNTHWPVELDQVISQVANWSLY